jgi:hypothetical protein
VKILNTVKKDITSIRSFSYKNTVATNVIKNATIADKDEILKILATIAQLIKKIKHKT